MTIMESKSKTLIFAVIICLLTCLIYPMHLHAIEGEETDEQVTVEVLPESEESTEEVVEEVSEEVVDAEQTNQENVPAIVEVAAPAEVEEKSVEKVDDAKPEENTSEEVPAENADVAIPELTGCAETPVVENLEEKELVEEKVEEKVEEVLPMMAKDAPALNQEPAVTYTADATVPNISVARQGDSIVLSLIATSDIDITALDASLTYDSNVFSAKSVSGTGLNAVLNNTNNTIGAPSATGTNVRFSKDSTILTVVFDVIGTIKGGKDYTFGFDIECNYIDEESFDDIYYNWSPSSLSANFSEGTHTHDLEYVAETPATCTEEGVKEHWYCKDTDCLKIFLDAEGKQEVTGAAQLAIPALGHYWINDNWVWANDYSTANLQLECQHDATHKISIEDDEIEVEHYDATCIDSEKTIYTAEVYYGDITYNNSKVIVGEPATGHSYVLDSWFWENDYSAATAVFVCEKDHDHVMRLDATIDSVKVEPTCEEGGSITYTAKVSYLDKEYKDTKVVNIDPLQHDYQFSEWLWAQDYSSAKAVFVCQNDDEHVITVEDNDIETSSTPSTCEGDSSTTYTASIMYNDTEYSDSVTVYGDDAMGHEWSFDGFVWAQDLKSAKAIFVCEHDESHVKEIDATMSTERIEPTCEEAGNIKHTASVTFEEKNYSDDVDEPIDALKHSYKLDSWTWAEDYSKATAKFVCENNPEHIQTVDATAEVTRVEPTCTEKGSITYKVKVTFEEKEYTDQKVVELDALKHNYKFKEMIWDMTGPKAMAKFVCENNAEHTLFIDAVVTTAITEVPTDTKAGKMLYTAEAIYEGNKYSAEKEVNAYTIIFDLNGGEIDGQKDTLKVVCGEGRVITIPKGPKKSGHTFKYWEGSKYYPGDKYTVTEGHTLKAIFEKDAEKSSDSSKDSSSKNSGKSMVNTGSDRMITVAALGFVAAAVLKKRLKNR